MDKILIRNLELRTIIGLYERERTAKQALILNLELRGDFSRAGKTDSLEGSVNYREVEEQVIALVENSSFHSFLEILRFLGRRAGLTDQDTFCSNFRHPSVVSLVLR